MALHRELSRQNRQGLGVAICALTTFLTFSGGTIEGQQLRVETLRIGTCASLAPEKAGPKEELALETLKNFIKEETGLNNEVLRLKDWRELAEQMSKGQLHLGVFQGYEFAWAQEKHPELKPLALAVNTYRYPVAYVVTRRDNKAKDFAGLQGQSLSLPAASPRFLRLYLQYESQTAGKKLEDFFSKIATPDNIEDALDDVVDGSVQAAAVDRAALEAYRRRKSGRFKQLKEVVHSQPFPPPLVAYYDQILDEATRVRFREGLLGASRKDKGETMLSLFRLTGFEAIPADFDNVLVQTRKAYPPPGPETK